MAIAKVLYPIVRDFNCVIGPNLHWTDRNIFPENEKVVSFDKADIFDVLIAAGAFESKSQARKNWQGIKEIPAGYSEIGPIGKGKLMMFIWNPSKEM